MPSSRKKSCNSNNNHANEEPDDPAQQPDSTPTPPPAPEPTPTAPGAESAAEECMHHSSVKKSARTKRAILVWHDALFNVRQGKFPDSLDMSKAVAKDLLGSGKISAVGNVTAYQCATGLIAANVKISDLDKLTCDSGTAHAIDTNVSGNENGIFYSPKLSDKGGAALIEMHRLATLMTAAG